MSLLEREKVFGWKKVDSVLVLFGLSPEYVALIVVALVETFFLPRKVKGLILVPIIVSAVVEVLTPAPWGVITLLAIFLILLILKIREDSRPSEPRIVVR